MVEIVPLGVDAGRVVPWRNGRGFTRELAIWPMHAAFERGDFDWRISAAGVDQDGPFSTFAGFDRLLVITAGEGMRLSHDAASPVPVVAWQPHCFSGDAHTVAQLIAGPIADFNVLTRRGRVTAAIDVVPAGTPLAREVIASQHAWVHAPHGGVTVLLVVAGAPTQLALVGGESVWLRDVEPQDRARVRVVASGGDALVVWVNAAGRSGSTAR